MSARTSLEGGQGDRHPSLDHPRRFLGDLNQLAAPARRQRLQVETVVNLCVRNLPLGLVLDVGTGTGLFAHAFQERGWPCVGVDPSLEALRRARELDPRWRGAMGVAEALPFKDSCFCLAFFGTVLHETDDPLAALREAKRVANRVAILEFPFINEPEGPPVDHRLSPARILELAQEAGFAFVEHLPLPRMELYFCSSVGGSWPAP